MAITGSFSHRAMMGAVVQVCSAANVDFSAASATEKAVLIERAEDHLRATHGLVVESQVIDGMYVTFYRMCMCICSYTHYVYHKPT